MITLSTLLVVLTISGQARMYSYGNEVFCPTTDTITTGMFPACNKRNCSQKMRFQSDSYFHCTIGMLQEWKAFKELHQVLENYESKSDEDAVEMNPPTVSAVGFHMISDSRNNVKNNPNLNLTFRLPRNNQYTTKALLVKFVGENDPSYPEVIDPFYKDNPRYRLFNFPLYRAPEIDKIHPREIVYGCFMGLDCQREKRVYLITLTAYTLNPAHPGSSLTYHFTVYTTRNFTGSNKLTLAMAYIHCQRKMHVVFEPLPEMFTSSDTYYDVQLMELDTGTLQTIQIKHGSLGYEHEFSDITNGRYIMEVQAVDCIIIVPCPRSQSGILEVDYKSVIAVTTDVTPHHLTSDSAAIYAAIGVAGGILLLCFLLACFMLSNDRGPKVVVLNSCQKEAHKKVATSLQQCLNPYFQTTLKVSNDTNFRRKQMNSKFAFLKQNRIIIATICIHVSNEDIERLWKRLETGSDMMTLIVWFSQVEINMTNSFHWYTDSENIIKFIKEKYRDDCFSRYKRSRPSLETISAEFDNFQEVINFTRPIQHRDPCPVHQNFTYYPANFPGYIDDNYRMHGPNEMRSQMPQNILPMDTRGPNVNQEAVQEDPLLIRNNAIDKFAQQFLDLIED
ncbi:uncharacterized protein [Argopecten irradians]|uniref:uncharacterized protein isoform X2 n=1 Tax=Argopecten irradians TaxID=31199 RepID=UPI00371F8A1B